MTDLDLMAHLNVEIYRARARGDEASAERLQDEKAAAYRRWIASR